MVTINQLKTQTVQIILKNGKARIGEKMEETAKTKIRNKLTLYRKDLAKFLLSFISGSICYK